VAWQALGGSAQLCGSNYSLPRNLYALKNVLACNENRTRASAIAQKFARRCMWVEMMSTVVCITQTDRVSAWGALSAKVTCCSVMDYSFYTRRCNKLYYHTTSMRCSVSCNTEVGRINKLRLRPMLLITSRVPPPAYNRGRGPPWRIDINFRR